MPTWLGNSGDINDAQNYLGLSIDLGNVYQNLQPIFGAAYINTSPINAQSNIIFGPAYPHGMHGPTKPPPGGESVPNGQILVSFLTFFSNNFKPPGPPPGILSETSSTYTVGGTATVNSIVVSDGTGGTITLAGDITVTEAANPTGVAALIEGATKVSGSLTVQTYALVSGNLDIAGTGAFTGVDVSGLGQASLVISFGSSKISAGGTATTAGVFVGTPQSYSGLNTSDVMLKVQGSLTDTDTTNGIQVGVGTGAIGTLFVNGGTVTAKMVTVGGLSGQGTLEIDSSGTLNVGDAGGGSNAGTLEIGVGGTLESSGKLQVNGATIDGSGTIDGGMFTVINAGTLTVDATGTLMASNSETSASLVQTLSGSTVVFNAATLDDTGRFMGQGTTGLLLDGTVDLESSTVTETTNGGSITVGYTGTSQTANAAAVTARDSTVVTNSTTIGLGPANNPPAGALTISGGTWTDMGSGTTMTIGAGGAGYLELTDGASLTDQDVAIGSVASSLNNGLSTASVEAGATWTINGGLQVGDRGQGSLSIQRGGEVDVAGTLSVEGSFFGSTSVVSVDGGTLKVGGIVTVTADMMVKDGLIDASSNQMNVVQGSLSIDQDGTLTATGGVTFSYTAAHASIAGGTLDAHGAAVILNGDESHIDLNAGTLLADTVTVQANAYIDGFGSVGDPTSPTTTVALNGGTLVADGGLLLINGSVGGGTIGIMANSAIDVSGTLSGGGATFIGDHGRLEVDAPIDVGFNAFSTTVFNLAGSDEVDVNVTANAARWVNGQLFLFNGGAAVSRFTLTDADFDYSNTQWSVVTQQRAGGAGSYSAITIMSGGPSATAGVKAGTPTAPDHPGLGSSNSVSVTPITDPNAGSVTANVSDLTGLLAASGAGGATVMQQGDGLSVSGSVDQVNAALATLTYTATTPGADTISIGVVDDQGGADTQSTGVMVADPGVTASVPAAQSVVAGTAAVVAGVAIADTFSDPSQRFTVTLQDVSGLLSANALGSATAIGAGSGTLILRGDLGSIDRSLATLSYTGLVGAAAPASDSIQLAVADPYGGTASQTIAVSVAQPIAPTETDWATGQDGDAGMAANWTAGVPSTALLTVAPVGSYTISGDIAAGKILVEGDATFTGTVSAADQGADYQAFVVQNQGGATFDGGTLDTTSMVLSNGSFDTGALTLTDGAVATLAGTGPGGPAESAYLGLDANSQGVLTVAGATLNAADGLALGVDGAGILNVNAGGTVDAGSAGDNFAVTTAGFDASGSGVITVDGVGSRFTTEVPFYLGAAGEGVLTVSDGGLAVSKGGPGLAVAWVGFDSGGQGIVSIDGAGSTWDVTQNLVLGADGAATASVTDGGTLEVDGSLLRIGRNAAAIGELDLYGAGSTLSASSAQLNIGLDGSASFSMGGGALANVSSVLLGGNADNVLASLDIEDAGTVLNVAGSFTDGASPNTTATVNGGTIATGAGMTIGDGAGDGSTALITVSGGGAITGGVTLALGGQLILEDSSTLGGTVALTGGSLNFESLAGFSSAVQVSGGAVAAQSTIDSNDSLDLSGGIVFDPAGGVDLLISGSLVLTGAVTGFAQGDTLDLQNYISYGYVDTASWSNNILTLSEGQSAGAAVETIDLVGNFANAVFSAVSDGNSGTDVTVNCFVADTRLLGAHGEIAVESLQPGDLLTTVSGAIRPIRWIGRRNIVLPRGRQAPVRIDAGAFGQGLPTRDLHLSPEHAILAEGVLIPVRALIDNAAVHVTEVDEVAYFHIELDTHDVVLANGLPCETYLAIDAEDVFDNRSDSPAHVASRPYAPILTQGQAVQRARDRLARQNGIARSACVVCESTRLQHEAIHGLRRADFLLVERLFEMT